MKKMKKKKKKKDRLTTKRENFALSKEHKRTSTAP